MLYGAYCRVSTEEQAKNETIDAQIDAIRAYFKKNNISVPKERWYIDDGVSGELMLRERPDGARLLLDAVEGKLTHLVVVRVNRIAREDFAAQEAFHTLKKCGVSLISLSEPFNYFEPSGQMMATVFSSFAAYDRATIKQNFADGKARKARRGKLPQGTIPYGYTVADDMSVKVNPDQAEVIKLVYKLYIEENMSLRAITEYLTGMGIPAPADFKGTWYRKHNRTGGWCEYSVNNILRSDIYTGIYPYKPPGQNPIPVPIPKIIDSETYFKARQIAQDKRKHYAPNEQYRTYLLRGLVECGTCHSAYVGTSSGKGRFAYYRCTKKKSDDMTCENPNINADLLENTVWEDLCNTFKNPQKLISEVSREMESRSLLISDYAAEISEIDKRVNEITQERKRLLDLYAKGITAENELVEAISEREESLDTLQSRKKLLVQQTQMQQNQQELVSTVMEIAREIKNIPDEADDELKMDLIKTLVDRVEIIPGESPKIRISYRISLGLFNECYLVR